MAAIYGGYDPAGSVALPFGMTAGQLASQQGIQASANALQGVNIPGYTNTAGGLVVPPPYVNDPNRPNGDFASLPQVGQSAKRLAQQDAAAVGAAANAAGTAAHNAVTGVTNIVNSPITGLAVLGLLFVAGAVALDAF